MMKTVLESILIGLLCAGAAFFVLGFAPGSARREKRGNSQFPNGRDVAESKEVEEKRPANSGKPRRSSPQSVWRGGSR